MRLNNYEYDAFISHAVEDKIPIANELCSKLENAGLKIWYSGKELGVGDSIEKTIQKGLNCSRYGIVIFSPTYLAKNWTIREFYTLLAKEIEEHKVILPVLYNVTLDDLKNKDLLMADRFAINADKGIDFVVQKLVHEIKKSQALKVEPAWFSKLWFILILSLLANVGFLINGNVLPGSGTKSYQGFEGQKNPVNASSASLFNERFFEDMNKVFSEFNSCSCTPQKQPSSKRGDASRHDGAKNFYLTSQSSGPSIKDEKPTPGHSDARKMTMALVFQMETGAPSQGEIKEDVESLLTSVSQAGTSAFGNSEVSEKAVSGNFKCLHPSHSHDR